MKQSDVFGKVLALTKQIYLQKPSAPAFQHKFFMGPRKRLGTFATEWWTTWDTQITCEDLAIAIMQSNPDLADGEVNEFSREIMDVMKEVIVDQSLFDFWKVFSHQTPTLFDAISASDKSAFAMAVYSRCEASCLDSVSDWLVIYPFHRVSASTANLGYGGLWLLDADDLKTWTMLHSKYPALDTFDISSGEWLDRKGPNLTKTEKMKAPAWVLCKVKSTADGARQRAARNVKSFLAVAFSIIAETDRGILSKTMWETSDYSIQFAASGTTGSICGSIGHLLPPLGVDISISALLLDEVSMWNRASTSACDASAKRAITASQFFHNAIMADGTERFLYSFVTLYALFGERFKVESEIIRGVRSLYPHDSSWPERCKRLFDLRSELVHGEISSIQEWSYLGSYRRHYRSHPLGDAVTLAMKALRQFFQLPREPSVELNFQI